MRPEKANIERLLKALNAFGFDSLVLNAADFETPEAMVQLGYPPARIDLLTAIDGVKFDEAFTNKLECNVSGTLLPVISIDDLIRNKLAVGRPKDLADVAMLREDQERSS